MIEWRGRQLNLSALHAFAIRRHHRSHEFAVLLENVVLLFLGESTSFLHQSVQLGIRTPKQGVNPHEIVPNLQITKCLIRVQANNLTELLVRSGPSAAIVEFSIPREWANHIVELGVEEILEDQAFLLFVQSRRIRHRQLPH